MAAKVLVIGSGGREHALAWKLAQSDKVDAIYVAPGNAGTTASGKISNVDVNVKDFESVAAWCKDHSVSLVVVGPEEPLAEGIADVLKKYDIPCFGPSAAAAEIEASKEFSKDFMTRHNIPTAKWKSFTEYTAAANFIKNADFDALVVKASGFAAGKGVIVAKCREEACQAAKEILQDQKFGTAGKTIVIEELLVGEEVSCLAFSDGKTVACFPPAQDHKRALDGDLGLNTGGMGAYCPCPLVSNSDFEIIKREVLQRTVDGMAAEGKPYVGVLYAGLMLTKDGPKTLEFNCRFGDPETQVILPLLETDLYTVMMKCLSGELASVKLSFQEGKKAVAVVAVSGGYPVSYKKGFEISGLETVEKNNVIFHAGTSVKDNKVVTSGGRVLAVVSLNQKLEVAAQQAQQGAADIQFEGKFFRKDIAHKAIKMKSPAGLSYKDAGVNIGAGDNLVSGIKSLAAMTARTGCSPDLGQFGGLFDLKATGFKDPLLVSGTDGVGTKLKVAQLCGLHKTVGEDLVAMCVNDILCHGAEPLFFLDYFACGKLEVGVAKQVIEGVANGCKLANCALLGGETAEMPGMYSYGDYDIAGFAVGVVERQKYLPKMADITEGDVIIAISSNGVHSNGFSLVRKVVENCGLTYSDKCPWDESETLGSSLLAPTQIYVKGVLPVLKTGMVKAAAHITGGGLPGNVCRVLPKELGAVLNATSWNMPPVFGWLQAKGNIETVEMAQTFNCGVGMVLIVSSGHEKEILGLLGEYKECRAVTAGKVTVRAEGAEQVKVTDLDVALKDAWIAKKKHGVEDICNDQKSPSINGVYDNPVVRKKVGVLISGSGTNLQALIDHTQNPANHSAAEIVVVISNKAGVEGLKRASYAGITTKVIPHKEYKSREDFDAKVDETLQSAGVEIVCLAGFMRILTGAFVRRWEGKMINIHPSLLPSFKGGNAHREVLNAHVRISGCTVHFVAEEVDSGAILVQESVPVYPTDTEATLSQRVKMVEHVAFPKALELLASGQAKLGENNIIQWTI